MPTVGTRPSQQREALKRVNHGVMPNGDWWYHHRLQNDKHRSASIAKIGSLPPSTKCPDGLSTPTTHQESKVCFIHKVCLCEV